MFSYERDASKIALVYLAARLAYGGFRLLDTQFVTDHLRQFGTVELNREEFHRLLEKALDVEADFHALPLDAAPDQILAVLEDAHAAALRSGASPGCNRGNSGPPSACPTDRSSRRLTCTWDRARNGTRRRSARRVSPSGTGDDP